MKLIIVPGITDHCRYLLRHLLHGIAALILIAAAAQASLLVESKAYSAEEKRAPNVVLIMADDLGYSDLGCYGSEIRTPVLDKLAGSGLQFTQFYNTGRCWPTRASLLTGYYPQMVRRDVVPGVRSGGRGVRPEWAPLLTMQLRKQGYRCYHSGKWHLDGMPLENGFDRSYYLRDQGRFFNPQVHYRNDKKLSPVKPGGDFYGTTAIADHAIEDLQEHATSYAEQPFFLYLAFTAPHFPLHALPRDIAKYKDKYADGWEKARQKRWQRIQSANLVTTPLSKVEPDVGPPYHFPDALEKLGPGEVNRPLPWAKLTPQQQQFQADKMRIHAAMIDRLDQEAGRVLKQVEAMGAAENTVTFFLSDNGASAEIMVRAGGHRPDAAPGSAGSYLCLGPGWSNCSNTPFRRHKTWVHEGGIATPLIVHWPAGIKQSGLRTTPAHVIDIVPTILQIAGVKQRQDSEQPTAPGHSLVPAFSSDHKIARDYLWWLHEGNRALRQGDWKLVAAKGDPWELYHLAEDRCETRNLATDHPMKVKTLEALWVKEFELQKKLATARQE